MRRGALVLLLLVVAVQAHGSAIQFQSSEEDDASVTSQLDVAVSGAVLDLGLRLERATWAAGESTVALSPVSVSAALAVTLLAARGATREELAKLLGADAAPAVPLHLGRQLALLPRPDSGSGVDVSLASAVFAQQDLPLSRRFVRLATEAFRSTTVMPLDFRGHGKEAQDAINAWVSRETRGKIAALGAEPPPPETRLVVASALYFNGAWEKPFPQATTVRRPFHVDKGERLEVSLMTNSADLPFLSDQQLGCTLLGLPYAGGRVTMYLVLPERGGIQPLKDLETALTASELRRLVSAANVTSVIVAVPRMTLETSLSLKEPLAALGVSALFDPARADLSGLLEDSNATVPTNQTAGLYVDKVLHKVRLEVTETGTVAAAVTALSVSRDGSRPVFRADRPFLFFIHDRDTGLVLFSGRVVRPTPHTVINGTTVAAQV